MKLKRINKINENVQMIGSGFNDLPVGTMTNLESSFVNNYVGYLNQKQIINKIANQVDSNATVLIENVDFQYDKRLDASTTEDATDGFGTVTGGIIDTGVSGSLGANKLIRIVENGKNIKDVTGLNLKVYAKKLDNPDDAKLIGSPKYNEIWVDPLNGKYILPRPIFWSKLEDASSIFNSYTYSVGAGVGQSFTESYVENYGIYAKFNKGFRITSANRSEGEAPIDSSSWGRIYPQYSESKAKGTCSYWAAGNQTNIDSIWGVYHRFYLTSNTYLQFYYDLRSGLGHRGSIFINGSEVAYITGTAILGHTTCQHFFITWDNTSGIKFYFNGSLLLEANGTWNTENGYPCLALHTDSSNDSRVDCMVDNIKIWLDVLNDPSFEYNGGNGREETLHSIYGSANGYKPYNLQVGYVYLNTPDASSIVMSKPGNNEAITLESAKNIDNGICTIQNGITSLRKTDYSLLTNNTDFQYDKRLDASTTEDAIDGFGSVSGGIIDSGVSGSLASGKYLRIVENGKNIKDVTGLNLKVYAKNLSNLVIPKSDKLYIDPLRGKIVFPRPITWSKLTTKLTSVSGLTENILTEIGKLDLYTYNQSLYYLDNTGGKFNNEVNRFVSGSSGPNCHRIYPACKGKHSDEAVISYWYYPSNTYSFFWYGVCNEATNSAGRTSGLWSIETWKGYRSYINGVQIQAYTDLPGFTYNTWHHAYILISKSKSLTGNCSLRLFIDGTEVFSTTTDFPDAVDLSQCALHIGTSSGDNSATGRVANIKYWDYIITENPSFEYNNGNGNESFLHYIYGSSNGYKPLLTTPSSGLGYFKVGSADSITRLKIRR